MDADHRALRRDHRIDAAVTAFKGSLWVRLSAQVYNEIGEYERLADAFWGPLGC